MWFDPDIEPDWYRHQLYQMYALLNQHERHELENEMSCEEKSLELQDDLIGRNE